MVRPQKPRLVNFQPDVTYYKPRGIPLSALEEVELTIDELEAVRLADFENLEQTEAAKEMKISQSTYHRILKKAHQKIAKALVTAKAIKIEGGEFTMPFGFGRGTGRGVGRGRGRMGGPFAAGPGGECQCTNPECGHTVPHQAGVPCYKQKCSRCGSPMIRKR